MQYGVLDTIAGQPQEDSRTNRRPKQAYNIPLRTSTHGAARCLASLRRDVDRPGASGDDSAW